VLREAKVKKQSKRPGGKSRPRAGGGATVRGRAPAAPHVLYVLSDSTGNLPRHMLAAFLTQFPAGTFVARVRSFLDSPRKVEAVFGEVAAVRGTVMHALVDSDAKALVSRRCRELGLAECDLTGAFIEFLAEASGVAPAPDRRRLHDVDEAYQRRVKAVEFALEHDDGLGLDTLHGADVVLVGVSRTSKTPTCMYLAQQGYKAGNVSLAMNVDPPLQLLALPPSKVAALVIDPSQLARIRSRRQAGWHMPDTAYNEAGAVEAEVQWSRLLFKRQGWATFDVTNQAIEETAARIVERLRLGASPPDGTVS
jgi:[pyruvate, water dikinase]-phosphate phosphotransferase / [pyruvate, water dikinase] kinase